jgi:molybdopterin-guanine dinucleotide biosynthesis protein A
MAGVVAAAAGPEMVVVLAVDLPLVTAADVDRLLRALDDPRVDAAAALDHRGRANPLLAAYRADVLRRPVEPGTRAAALLPPETTTVDLGLAGTLNVNTAADLEEAEAVLRANDRP